MLSPTLVHGLVVHFKFFDIFIAFLTATLLFARHCKPRPHFWLRAVVGVLLVRLLCLVFAYTYSGNIVLEAFYSSILLSLMLVGLMACYQETV